MVSRQSYKKYVLSQTSDDDVGNFLSRFSKHLLLIKFADKQLCWFAGIDAGQHPFVSRAAIYWVKYGLLQAVRDDPALRSW